jgi:long-chain acyl-CoA synthetase
VKRIHDSIRRHAGSVALLTPAGPLSYADLERLVGIWRDRLAALGGHRVAYQLDNGADFVALNLALLDGERIGIPIPAFFSTGQREFVLSSSGADLFVGSALPGPGWASTRHGTVYRNPSAQPGVLPPSTALVTYTSGTTGEPKGVCLSAATLLDTAESVCTALAPAAVSRHMSVLPLSLLLENVAGVLANLLNGGTTVLFPLQAMGLNGSSGLDLDRFVAAQNEMRPESLILVPQLLLALTVAGELGMALPDTYRFVAVGGGRVSEHLLERARAVGIPAYEGYGLTECGSVVTLNLPGADRPGSVGRPLAHARVTVVDGEVCVGGSVMEGYVGAGRAPRAIATGDLGWLDDAGYLHVRGRRSSSYSTAFGRNVSPEWVESELTCEVAIAHAAVFGAGEPVNIALLAPRAGADRDALTHAVQRANERLPDYARIAAWHPVDAAKLTSLGALTDNGRLRRSVVAELYAARIKELFDRQREYA